MKTKAGLVTFCTNIFPGKNWEEHFSILRRNLPVIKEEITPEQPFGIGLYLSNKASLELNQKEKRASFQKWLKKQGFYVFGINGFPYGDFHRKEIKDKVHFPDWTTNDRLQYTLRLFDILSVLLPEGMDGGVTTSPLSYKPWLSSGDVLSTLEKSTKNIIEVVLTLINIARKTGKILHLDIEPEADGLIGSSDEFIDWFQHDLIPLGVPVLCRKLNITQSEAEVAIRKHIKLCYDVCHFAVGFESASTVLKKLQQAEIEIGRWQLSAALRIPLNRQGRSKDDVIKELKEFNEPMYLHQVVARQSNGSLLHFSDLPKILQNESALRSKEWRSHFHVPLFVKEYGCLKSTQGEVKKVISIQKKNPICDILEVETYTWEVLPEDLKLPIVESIIREIKWVLNEINS
jgi:hypothetical protein